MEIELDQSVSVALINIDYPISDSDVSLDIWGYQGQSAIVDIKDADDHEVNINLFEVIAHNYIELKFAIKNYAVKIKNLVLKYAGVNYLGGAVVDNLEIITNSTEQNINSAVARNIRVHTQFSEDEEVISRLLKSIEIIPGCGDLALNGMGAKNVLNNIQSALPSVKLIAPVVAWFADSLDIGRCKILPGVESRDVEFWHVSKYDASSAHSILYDGQRKIHYGRSIADSNVVDFLSIAKEQGFNIIFYPLIMVDVAGKPWRGHMTGNAYDVEFFYQNYYRPFIIHYATLVKDKVDAFIIGSELVGLTRIHNNDYVFPFVEKLIELASDVRAIMGSKVKLTYAADWSEYHTSDGVHRPLDSLWASQNIDFVGIDAYFPLTHSVKSRIEISEIKDGWHGGEGWDYYLDNEGNSHSFNNQEWNQWKNLEYWWNSEHWVGSSKTLWQPQMKKIWFTEFGFPSIDKASNKPNVFFDPKSSDGGIPTYSSGKIDCAIQRRALRATLEFWENSAFIENMICWTWDSRGINWRNMSNTDGSSYYADGPLWEYGHWIDGKICNQSMVCLTGKLNFDTIDVDAEYLYIKSLKNTKYSRQHIGSKTTLTFYDEYVDVTSISALKCNFKIKNTCFIEGSILDIGDLKIEARDLNISAIIAQHKSEELFQGKKDWKNERQKSTITKKWEEAYTSVINTNSVFFEIKDTFTAIAVKMYLNNFYVEAYKFEFSGLKLVDFYSKEGRSKGGLVSPSKHHSEVRQLDAIEGVVIDIGGKAFMFASGKICLLSTGIKASELYIKSSQLELKGLIGSQYHGMKVGKKGIKCSLICNMSEVSFGPELYFRESKIAHYKEHAYLSMLLAQKLVINTDMLLQNGGIISSKSAKIQANQWLSKALQLVETTESSEFSVSAGLKIGVKNHISGLVKNFMQTGEALQQIVDGDNRYAPVNTALGGYNVASGIASLSSGSLVSFGGWFSLNGGFVNSSSTITTPIMNQASFEHLEVEASDIIGDLEIDARHSSIVAKNLNFTRQVEESSNESNSFNIGLEIGESWQGNKMGGLSINHSFRDNDKIIGFGIQCSLGDGGSSNMPSINFIYGDKNGNIDITYQPMHLDEIEEVFSKDGLEKIRDNIGSVISTALNEENIVSIDDQWQEESRKDEFKSKHRKAKKKPTSHIDNDEETWGGERVKISARQMAGIPEGFGYDAFAANNPPAGIDPSSWRASIYSKRDDYDSRENNVGFFEKLYQDSLRGVHKQGEGKYLNYDEIESSITREKNQAKGAFIGKEIAGAGALLNIATSEAGKAYAKTFPRIKAVTDIGLRGVGEVIIFAGKGITNFAIASSYDEALQMSGGKLKTSDWDNHVNDALEKSGKIVSENTTDGQRTMAGIAFGAAGTFVGKKIKLHNASNASNLKMKPQAQHNARHMEGSSVLFKKSFDDTGISLKSKDYAALHNSKVDVSSKPFIKDYSALSGEFSVDRSTMKSKGWVDAYKESFPNEVNWTAPNGTKQTYKVHQRDDINWDHVRTNPKGPREFVGKTNTEAALSGFRPELEDGNFVSLHHVGQNAIGPLVETSTKLHDFNNKEAFKVLHNQFSGKKHPDFPVNHDHKWKSDVREYWKWRINSEK